ncbi:MAG: D-alanyl-D-alanine carboxypeptidase, partial [Chlamydiae bacterium]|nr:D-alanyl-D-alanine carboxypeptidase [Chlamydiota bacterium]
MKWLLVLILGWVHQGYASSLHCEVGAPVAIVIDAESGKVLFEKNAKIPCYPASTTKIATALYTLCRRGGDLHQKVIASQDAIATVSSSIRRNSGKHPSYRLEFGGTHIGIRVGEILSLETLLYGLMLASGNDAANVLAESVSGTVSRFMEELNGFLQQIGCKATHFTNPHGLPDVDHRTTAWDLARMALVAMKIPAFRTIVSSKQFEREETNKQQASFLMQGNGLLRPGSKHFYPYATGIKTGYTGQSGYNLVASASKNGRNIIAVVCQCEDLSKRYRSVHQLFDMVFQELKQTRKLLCREH